jgi:hypothetical protein
MIEQANLWVTQHPWLLAAGVWLLGWFCPDPWTLFMNNFHKWLKLGLDLAEGKLKRSGATKEQVVAWYKRLKLVISETDKVIDEEIAEESNEKTPESPEGKG